MVRRFPLIEPMGWTVLQSELNDTVDDAFDAVKNSLGSGFGF